MDMAIERGKNSIGASAPWLASDAWSSKCRTTRWSVVFAAASEGEAARRAFSTLYRAYWRPLYAFVARRRGHQAAAELTQRFFAEELLMAGALRRLERRPGQLFRGWLFTALRRFLIRQSRSERCRCRDVDKTVAWSGGEPSDSAGETLGLKAVGHDAERQLERARTLSLLGEVIARLRQEYEAHARTSGVDGAVRFEALKVFLPGPNAETADYAECSAALGMKATTTKQVVKRLRARFAELLVARLRQDLSSDSEVPQALKDLCASLELPATYPEAA